MQNLETAKNLVNTRCDHLRKESDKEAAVNALLAFDRSAFWEVVCKKQHTQKQWKKGMMLSSLADYVFDLWEKILKP